MSSVGRRTRTGDVLSGKLGSCHAQIDMIPLVNQFEVYFKSLTSGIMLKAAIDSDQYVPAHFYYYYHALRGLRGNSNRLL